MSAANVGKQATWPIGSHRGRPTRTRTGFIVAFVPAGASLAAAAMKASGKSYSPVDAKDITTSARYLVRVDRETARGPRSEWFAPYASIIDAALAATLVEILAPTPASASPP